MSPGLGPPRAPLEARRGEDDESRSEAPGSSWKARTRDSACKHRPRKMRCYRGHGGAASNGATKESRKNLEDL